MNIASRISRIESAISRPAGAVLLREPDADASEEEQAEFSRNVADAISCGATVIVRCHTDLPRLAGVTYFDNDFDAWLRLLSASPSDTHANALAELIANCATTLPVVREVSP